MKDASIEIFRDSIVKSVFVAGGIMALKHFNNHKKAGDLCILKGNSDDACILVDGGDIHLGKSKVLALSHTHHIETINGEYNVLHFNKEFYCIQDHDHEVNCAGLLFYNHLRLQALELNDVQSIHLNMLFDNLLKEFSTLDRLSGEMFRSMVKQIIILLTRQVKYKYQYADSVVPNNDLLRQFNVLVEEHFKKEHTVSFYASELFKAPKTLSNSFKKLNTSPLQIIHDRIVLEAKRLLMYSERSLKEVAFELGFSDPSNLGRIFKKLEGVSMSEFKTHFLNKG